jgi:hypothetical protein
MQGAALVNHHVGSVDDYGGELRVLRDHFLAHRRLESLPILLNPLLQVEHQIVGQFGVNITGFSDT